MDPCMKKWLVSGTLMSAFIDCALKRINSLSHDIIDSKSSVSLLYPHHGSLWMKKKESEKGTELLCNYLRWVKRKFLAEKSSDKVFWVELVNTIDRLLERGWETSQGLFIIILYQKNFAIYLCSRLNTFLRQRKLMIKKHSKLFNFVQYWKSLKIILDQLEFFVISRISVKLLDNKREKGLFPLSKSF